jgi:hypothetical protein
MVATRRRSEGVSESGLMSLNLVPSMYSSVKTLGVVRSRYTLGITTSVPAKLAANRRAFSASAV